MMNENDYVNLRYYGEKYGYGFIQQLMTGLWSKEHEDTGLPKYDVPVATIFGFTEEQRKKEIDVARYVVEQLESKV